MWFDDTDIDGRGIVRPAVGELGQATRELRHMLWMSQAQFGATVGVHQTAVSKLELGSPNWRLFCRLVDAVGGRAVVKVERSEDLVARMIEADPWSRL